MFKYKLIKINDYPKKDSIHNQKKDVQQVKKLEQNYFLQKYPDNDAVSYQPQGKTRYYGTTNTHYLFFTHYMK